MISYKFIKHSFCRHRDLVKNIRIWVAVAARGTSPASKKYGLLSQTSGSKLLRGIWKRASCFIVQNKCWSPNGSQKALKINNISWSQPQKFLLKRHQSTVRLFGLSCEEIAWRPRSPNSNDLRHLCRRFGSRAWTRRALKDAWRSCSSLVENVQLV